MRYALVNSSNLVVNVILWDGESSWTPPSNLQMIETSVGDIGDTYEDGQFIKPPPPPSDPEES